MRWIDAVRARLRLALERGAAESRMRDEFQFHLEMETEKNVRAGMSPPEARRQAAVAFGGMTRHTETMRDGRGFAWLSGWSLDLKLGARMLAKHPGLAIVGGLGLALAIAIGAGTYAVFNTYFYPGLPLHEGDRVVMLANHDPRLSDSDSWLLPDFAALRAELGTVHDVSAFRTVRRNLIAPSGEGEPIAVAEMSARGFRVARVAPLLGRALADEDERAGSAPVIVIGHDVWESRFARDPAVLGRTLRLGHDVYTIVGVMPRGFAFPISHSYWVPLRGMEHAERSTSAEVQVFGRLAPNVTTEAAQAELRVVERRLASERADAHPRREALVLPYTDVFAEGEAASGSSELLVFQLIVTLILVLVALNVGVLVYARTVGRTGEIAVRTALGATRSRVVSQLFAEALVLALLSSIVGLGIVSLGLSVFDRIVALVSETGRAPFWIDPGLSLGTIVHALLLAVLAAVIVGVLPALRATGSQLRTAMVGLTGGTKAQLGRTWTFFIVAQVAIAVVALPPAISKGSELLRQATQPLGFPAHEFLAARFQVADVDAAGREPRQAGDESTRSMQAELLARLADMPGVIGVTVASRMPGGEQLEFLEAEGVEGSAQVRAGHVDASWFDVFGVRVVAGRGFGAGDAALASNRPVIVNRSFVAEILAGDDPLGRRVRYRSAGDSTPPWLEIVGVIDDFPRGYKNPDDPAARIYHLAAPDELPGGVVMTRLRGTSPDAFARRFRQLVTSVDPTLQLVRMSALDRMYAERSRMMALLGLAIALMAGSVLLLSAAGIHALMSFTINQRRKEIGIRAALGADARRILTGVLSRAIWQLGTGVALGLALAVALERWSDGEMMGGQGLLLVPVIAIFMALVGLVAAAGPARRGLRVHPSEALRAE